MSLGYYFVQRARTHARTHTHIRAHTRLTHTRLLKPPHARTHARRRTHIDATTCYLIGLISKDDDSAFLSQVDSFVNHSCDAYYLELDVSKSKEMVIDFRQTSPDPQLVDIKGSSVARVDTHKYLGIVLNNKLSWGDHVDLNSRMYCLRKLNSFHITPEILNVFYSSTIVSVWRYCLECAGEVP